MSAKCRLCGIGKLYRKAMEDCGQGRCQEAREKLDMALEGARELQIACFEAKILNSLGIVDETENLNRQAALNYHEALRLTDRKLGRDNIVYRTIANNLARVQSPIQECVGENMNGFPF